MKTSAPVCYSANMKKTMIRKERRQRLRTYTDGGWLATSIVHVRRFFGSATLQLSMFAFSYN